MSLEERARISMTSALEPTSPWSANQRRFVRRPPIASRLYE